MAVVALVVLGACAAPLPVSDVPVGSQALGAADPAELQDGGDLRLPLVRLPANYNALHVDGGTTGTRQVVWAFMPRVFDLAADGGSTLSTDYVDSATMNDPLTISYVVDDDARWSNGRPIDWTDFAAQAAALNGADARFLALGLPGYQRIVRVERGATDKEAMVTLDRPLPEWQDLFSPLYPRETTGDPEEFNTAWIGGPVLTAGPFRVSEIDDVGGRAVFERDPAWWGTPPRLDRLIFVTVVEGLPDLLANDELDWIPVSRPEQLGQVQGLPGVEVRSAPDRQWAHLTFNGAPGRILADRTVRRAVAAAIDRTALAQGVIGLIATPTPTGNHIYAVGSPQYRDNSDVLPFDRAAAAAALDAAGWALPPDAEPDAVRSQGGVELRLQFPAAPGSVTPLLVRDQLRSIGVAVDIVTVPPAQFVDRALINGDFDLVGSQWTVPATPLSFASLALDDPAGSGRLGNNLGSVTTPGIRQAFAEALAEPDNAIRARLGNELDRMIWAEAHSLPLYALPGVHAVRADLANFGARGLGDWDYLRAGFRAAG